MKVKNKTLLIKVHDFFERPDNIWAYAFQVLIILFIFVSVGITILEFFYHSLFVQNEAKLHFINNIILVVFTVEYVLRLISADKKWHFVKKPFNIVDFLAVAPNYVELLLPFFVPTAEIRLLRLLRLSRLIRAFKIFEYRRLVAKVFVLQDTILEAMFPVLLIFMGIKGTIWLLEAHHLWFSTPDLSNLFATIGFALGIILSQKIGVSYDKFLNIEETIVRIYGNLHSLSVIVDEVKLPGGRQAISAWSKAYLTLLQDPKANNFRIHEADKMLYHAIAQMESQPAELALLCGEISKDAAYTLSKKTRITPKAYDVLLHQATILYLVLMAMFIPGLVGLASVLIATYVLYGMYELTEDLDSILGGTHNLININMDEIKSLIKEK